MRPAGASGGPGGAQAGPSPSEAAVPGGSQYGTTRTGNRQAGPRVFSGIQPSGDLHIGNYLGAIRGWAEEQDRFDAIYCIVDLHALTVEQDPARFREQTLETARNLMAAGLDPERCTLFVQSHVVEHVALSWLLQCTTSFGELRRMTQFKDKSAGRDSVSVGLFTYPVLQAADILLYGAEKVPIGDDQRQHLELTRDVAMRFNHRYGETFIVPEAVTPKVAARVMDLQNPTAKMSKSAQSPLGTVLMLDPPDAITRKVRRAVTDSIGQVAYDPERQPGVATLLEILAATTNADPKALAGEFSGYGELKNAVAEALVEELRPVRERSRELGRDPGEVLRALRDGAARATELASMTLARARHAMGLLDAG